MISLLCLPRVLHLFSLVRNKAHKQNAEFVCSFLGYICSFWAAPTCLSFLPFLLVLFHSTFFHFLCPSSKIPVANGKVCVCVCLGISCCCCCCCGHVDVPQFCSFLHRKWLCVGLAIFGVAAAALFIGNLVWAAVPELALSLGWICCSNSARALTWLVIISYMTATTTHVIMAKEKLARNFVCAAGGSIPFISIHLRLVFAMFISILSFLL